MAELSDLTARIEAALNDKLEPNAEIIRRFVQELETIALDSGDLLRSLRKFEEDNQTEFDLFLNALKADQTNVYQWLLEMRVLRDQTEQSAINAEAAASMAGYQGLWPDSGGSAEKGETWQTQVGGTPTGQYFTALQNTTVVPANDNVNWKAQNDYGDIANGLTVKHRRGTQSEVDTFIGVLGEIVVNITEEELVLNNGVTQGGIPIPKKRNTVLSFDTLSDAVNNTSLKVGYSIELKERVSGKGGGAMWDVVLSSTVVPNDLDIVQCTSAPSLSLSLRDKTNTAAYGLRLDGVTDDGPALQTMISAGITPRFPSGRDIRLSPISVSGDVFLDFNNCSIATNNTLADLHDDIFNLKSDCTTFKLKNVKSSSCRATIMLSQNFAGSIDIQDVEIAQQASLIAGNGLDQDCGTLLIERVKAKTVEQTVNLKDYGFSKVDISEVYSDDCRYRSISNRGSASNIFGKYYTGGVFIAMGSNITEKTVNLTNITTSNVTRQDVDPYDSSPITVQDRECHSAGASLDGEDTTVIITGCSGLKFTGTGQDVEPILARAENVTVIGCSVLDTTADEGAIYTKGATSAVVTGNVVRFTASPVDINTQRGLIVTAPSVLINNNTFTNCGRAISARTVKLDAIGNKFETCLRTIASALVSNAEELNIKSNIFDRCQLAFNDDSGSFTTDVLSFTSNTFKLDDSSKIATFANLNIKHINFVGNDIMGSNQHDVDRFIAYQPSSNTSEVTFTFINNIIQNILHNTSSTNIVYFSGDCSSSNVTIQGNQVTDGNIGFRVRDELFNNLVVRNNVGYNLTSSLVNSNAGTTANNVLDLTGNLQ